MPNIAFKKFITTRSVYIPVSIALLLDVFIWAYLAWFIRPTDELLVLHYTIHFGVDYIGKWSEVFVVPLIGLLFLLVNSALSWWFYRRIRVLSIMFNITSATIQIALAGVAVLIVFLNT
tara:strand:+ start:458 stop:814 length:357 start_codon:yes stop_codon:yes gene_type:complete